MKAFTIDPEHIKSDVSLADLVTADGHELRRVGANLVCRCMFHEERSGSFTVHTNNRFHCYGCGAGGSNIDWMMQRHGLDYPAALARLAGRPTFTIVNKRPPAPAQSLRAWPAMHKGTPEEVETVARLRGVGIGACRIANDVGWLRFGRWKGAPAWFIADTEGRNAQARRMDGAPWVIDGKGVKAQTLPGARAGWPIGIAECAHYPAVALVEGGPDLLGALHFIQRAHMGADVCPVAVLGASNRLPDDALDVLAGKRVRIYTHADASGETAAARWAEQLTASGCDVDSFNFVGLRRDDGAEVSDLNDAARIHPDDAAQLEGLLP
jgi:hypothetical protein